jgi:hypothetical protein
VPSNHRFDATFFLSTSNLPLRQIAIISASVTSWAVIAALIDQPTNSLPVRPRGSEAEHPTTNPHPALNEATPRHQTF